MSSENCFMNVFEEFSSNSVKGILSESMLELSENFKEKLHNYTTATLQTLLSMEMDIFYDYTVYTGSAGVALYYFLCSMNKNEIDYDVLKESMKYLKVNKLKGKKISFLCGDAGPLALATVVTYKLGSCINNEMKDFKFLIERLLSLISLLEDSPDEILYGKSGYLFALLFVNKYVDKELIPPDHIRKVVSSILKSGKKFATEMKSDCPLLWQWHDKIYLGAAHGMAGILYMLLQARSHISTEEMQSLVKPTLDWLLKHQYKSGNFPSSLKSSSGDRLVQWCHGAPGFVSVFLLAYKVFNEEKYLNTALECGEVTWRRGLCTKGYSICHGVSGNAYVFIELFQATKDASHLYRACCFMKWVAEARPGTERRGADRPASLFEGLAGRLYLAQDLLNPQCAGFPAFSL